MKDAASPEEIRAEELTLKKFGFVPPDFDLAKTTVDLLTEQAAAFYDYNKKKLFITDSTPSTPRAGAGARAIARPGRTRISIWPGSSARDARATTEHRAAGRDGRPGHLADVGIPRAEERPVAEGLARARLQYESPGRRLRGDFPVYDRAPLYMRLTLVFPYATGMLFQNRRL